MKVATLALDAALTARVLVPLPGAAIDDGTNVAVTFFASPVAARLMVEEKPLSPTVETVSGIDPPRGNTIEVPLKVRVKLGLMMVRTAV